MWFSLDQRNICESLTRDYPCYTTTPVYMQKWPLITNNEIHQYNTPIASDLHTFIYHHTFARKSLRHYLVQTINNTPDNVFSKFGTYNLNGFSNYVKLRFINNYQDGCNIPKLLHMFSPPSCKHRPLHVRRHTNAETLARTPSHCTITLLPCPVKSRPTSGDCHDHLPPGVSISCWTA